MLTDRKLRECERRLPEASGMGEGEIECIESIFVLIMYTNLPYKKLSAEKARETERERAGEGERERERGREREGEREGGREGGR